jgi:hypothetical protein
MATITYELAEQTIRSLGLILSHSTVYGPQHSVTRNATDACFQHLSGIWQTADVCIQLSEEDLSVNSTSVEQKNPVIKSFVGHLEERDISNFTLKPTMTREQFAAFIEILLAKPGELQQLGEFSGAIVAVGLADVVTSRKVTYMEVTEDEVVVEKNALLKQDAGSEAETLAKQAQEASAYLRGEATSSETDAAACLRELSTDADLLSSLIVESTHAHGAAGEDLAKEIVASLHRLYLAMTNDPTFHTQKTKKQIHKTLVLLEKELIGKLEASGCNASPEDIQSIKDAIETMEDELTIDTLSQEYVKRRSAIGNSEKRILRFMKNKSVDTIEESDLKSRLIEGGLAPEDWHDLLIKSGAIGKVGSSTPGVDTTVSEPGQGPGTFGHLNDLLKKIEENTVKPDDAQGLPAAEDTNAPDRPSGKKAVMLRVPEEILAQDLHAVQQEVNRIILNAEKRIEKLVMEVEGDENQKQGRESNPRLSQKRLFEILAELGQELRQPLAVINCAVDSLLSGMLGEITTVQRSLLDLSADSSRKLNVLIDKIVEIAGVPDDLEVNKEIQAALYQ